MDILNIVILGLLVIAEIVVVSQFIRVGWPKRSNKSTVLKCTGSLIFILTAVAATIMGGGFSTVAWIMLVGFCMSLIGDFWLDLEINDKHILMGIIFFFMAHLSYIVAFVQVCKRDLGAAQPFTKTEIIAVVVMFVVAAAGSFIIKMDMRKLLIPVGIYSLTIATMVVKSIVMCSQLLSQQKMEIWAVIVLSLGTLLFIISDIVLAFMYFHDNFTKKMRIVNLSTYFAGQTLMAISLLEMAN